MLFSKKIKLDAPERNALYTCMDRLKSIHSLLDSLYKQQAEMADREIIIARTGLEFIDAIKGVHGEIAAMSRGQDAVLKNMSDFFKAQTEWTKKQIDLQEELRETPHDKKF